MTTIKDRIHDLLYDNTRDIIALDPAKDKLLEDIMEAIAQTLKNLALNATDKTLRQHNLEDENGKMTNEARDLMREEMEDARWAERREAIAKQLQEVKE